MKIASVIAILITLCAICYILKPGIGDFLLKKDGVCIKGILTSDIIRVRYHKGELKYKVTIGNKSYEGNSLESDKSKVGDSVCIIYLESRPAINKPLKYFKNMKLNCDCGLRLNSIDN